MDIMSVTNPTGFRLFSYMNFSWGLLADMGMSKTHADFGFNLATLNRLLSPNVYNGTLHYLVPSKRLEFTAEESVRMAQPNSEAERLAKPGPIDHFTTVDTEFLPKHWETVTAAFSMLLVANMPWVNKKLVANPLATANDGAVDLIYTQSGLLGFLTWLFFPSKAYHMNLPNWNFKRARAFILEPGKDLDGKDGNFLVDGQKIPYSSIRCEVHPGLIKVITPQRKIQSQESKATAYKEKWNQLAKRSSWNMVSLETYKQQMVLYWVGAFSLLAVCFAYAVQL
jgi:hypothetical protein